MIHQHRILRALRAFTLSLGLLCAVVAQADGQSTFWEVTGKHNKLWLFGSVHVLHSSDMALPPVANQAYGESEVIVEELNIEEMIGDAFSAAGQRIQMLPEGQTLTAAVGPELYARLQQEARKLGLDLDFMQRMQPWFVALQIQSLRLMRAGFNPVNGVDMQIAIRARQDGKPLRGLETVADQMDIFAGLSMAEQREFLRGTLDEDDSAAQLREITAAWRRGDVQMLGEELRKGAAEAPALFKKLTIDRNLRWLPEIEKMLQDRDRDYLVVAGALHMVGRDGLVELLRSKGYKVEQK
jgi:uncharacterized protein YbaP (TraB family)